MISVVEKGGLLLFCAGIVLLWSDSCIGNTENRGTRARGSAETIAGYRVCTLVVAEIEI